MLRHHTCVFITGKFISTRIKKGEGKGKERKGVTLNLKERKGVPLSQVITGEVYFQKNKKRRRPTKGKVSRYIYDE